MTHVDVRRSMKRGSEQRQIRLGEQIEEHCFLSLSVSLPREDLFLPINVTGTPYSSAAMPVHLPVPF